MDLNDKMNFLSRVLQYLKPWGNIPQHTCGVLQNLDVAPPASTREEWVEIQKSPEVKPYADTLNQAKRVGLLCFFVNGWVLSKLGRLAIEDPSILEEAVNKIPSLPGKGGRPKGSKNKPKAETQKTSKQPDSTPPTTTPAKPTTPSQTTTVMPLQTTLVVPSTSQMTAPRQVPQNRLPDWMKKTLDEMDLTLPWEKSDSQIVGPPKDPFHIH